MKKIMYNVLAALLAVVVVVVIAIGVTSNNDRNDMPTISVVDKEVENEINRVYKGMAEETVSFYNAYGTESADVLY